MIVAKEILRQKFPRVDAESTLSEAFGLIIKEKEPCIAVFEGDTYLGLLSHRELLKKHVAYSYAKTKTFVDKFMPSLSADDNLLKIINLMYQSGSRALPVFQDSKLLGFVHIKDVLKKAFDEFELAKLKLSDIASEPILLSSDDTLGRALAMMREHNIKQVPVVDKNKNLLGILTLESLIDKYFVHATPKRELFSLKGHEPEAKSLFDLSVSGLMEEAVAAESKQTLGSVKDQICDTKTVVLVENKKPKGIVATQNILEAILNINKPQRNIQISNMPGFTEPDKEKAFARINSFYDKATKLLGHNPLLSIHFKSYEKQGMRKKHAVHTKISGATFSAKAEASSWNSLTALQQALDTLMKELAKYHDKHKK